MKMSGKLVRAGAIVGACAFLGGCVKENMRLTLGPDVPLETFTPTFQNAATAPTGDKPLSHKETSLAKMDWKEVDFPVPNDGVGHRPTYRTEYARVKKTTRQRRETPTAESCLELGEDTIYTQMYEAFVFTPGILIYDTVSMPFRAIAYPPWKHVRYSPRFSYERDPRTAPDEDATQATPAAAEAKCSNAACTDACKCAPGACTCPKAK